MRIGLTVLFTLSSITIGLGAMTTINTPNDSTIKVLILPAYDEIANAGISPDTRTILESALTNQRQLLILPFPFKKLMGVPYQMVFDKKYCRPIVNKVDCDIIVMVRIITDNERKPGIWPWSYKIRIYNTSTDKQLDSIQGDDLKPEEFQDDISRKVYKLVKDIDETFKSR